MYAKPAGSVSSTDFALGTGTRSQEAMLFSSSNADMSIGQQSQEDVPVDEPCHDGGNITRLVPMRDYVPDCLNIPDNLSAWVPRQQDTCQQHFRRISEMWPISLQLVILYLINVPYECPLLDFDEK